jgi:hypothetical protein
MNKENQITALLGWLVIIGPLHMIEQLIFGIDKFYDMRKAFAGYYRWFDNPDYGTVTLITFFGGLFFLCVYAMDKRGRWRSSVAVLFALLCIGEIHHPVMTLVRGAYNPGLITAIPFIAVGPLLIRAVLMKAKTAPRKTQVGVA